MILGLYLFNDGIILLGEGGQRSHRRMLWLKSRCLFDNILVCDQYYAALLLFRLLLNADVLERISGWELQILGSLWGNFWVSSSGVSWLLPTSCELAIFVLTHERCPSEVSAKYLGSALECCSSNRRRNLLRWYTGTDYDASPNRPVRFRRTNFNRKSSRSITLVYTILVFCFIFQSSSQTDVWKLQIVRPAS